MKTTTLTIGTNWSKEFIEQVALLNKNIGRQNNIKVSEVYGSIPNDVIGSARSKDKLHNCNYGVLEEHVKLCHDKEIEVAYANNALCIGSLKSLDTKVDIFLEHLMTLDKTGIDSIILAFPFLIELTKKHFPRMKVYVSTIAHVDSTKMLKYYQEMGANKIALPIDVNRDFRLLHSLKRESGNLDLEVLMTDACIFECPYRQNHFALQSHDSVEENENPQKAEVKNYPFDRCWRQLIANWPAEFLKSRWIRPEDLHIYEKIGIDKFKISGRTLPEEWILRSTKAYLSREWSGNILDIFPIIPGNYKNEGLSTYHLSNKQLDGFIDYFLQKGDRCRIDCGTECNYCDSYAIRIKDKQNE